MRSAPAFQLVTCPSGVEHEDGVIGDALDQQAKAPLGLEQGLLGLALLGHVARDLGEADQFAVLGADAVDDDARPEARAVLAHPPAVTLKPAFGPGDFEHLRRQAGFAVLIGVEGRKMLADDLVGAGSP